MELKTQTTLFFLTTIAAIVLSLICVVLPVWQWASLVSSKPLAIVAGAAGFGVAVCKLTFAPLAVLLGRQGNKIGCLVLGLVAAIATWLSINASATLFALQENNAADNATQKTASYRNAKTALQQVNNDINALNELINRDLNGNYRARALENRKLLTDLYRRQDKLASLVDRGSRASHASQQSTFAKNITLSLPGFKTSLDSPTIAATSLHVMALVAVLAIGPWSPLKNDNKEKKNDNTSEKNDSAKNANRKTEKNTNPKTIKQPGELEADQLNLAKRICSGEFGNSFALRNVVAAAPIKGGHKRIRKVFDWLELQNSIVNAGYRKGYTLTQTVIE
ncbi:hypothetical protein P886_3811 [Alteromonadaceae bacterium 2753L.S.0a.02]|nr:hypothetical protein P886_3811 [Alteromonadaceae bacterium 2753L.S.0a.02]